MAGLTHKKRTDIRANQIDQLCRNLHRLQATNYEDWVFANDLVRQFVKDGELSERQWKFVPGLLKRFRNHRLRGEWFSLEWVEPFMAFAAEENP